MWISLEHTLLEDLRCREEDSSTVQLPVLLLHDAFAFRECEEFSVVQQGSSGLVRIEVETQFNLMVHSRG